MLISRLSWTFGLFLGPIVSGQLTETLGYYEMSCVLGKFIRHFVKLVHLRESFV